MNYFKIKGFKNNLFNFKNFLIRLGTKFESKVESKQKSESIFPIINYPLLTKVLTVLFAVISLSTTAVWGNVIHSHTTGFPLSQGVTYEQTRRITRAGLVDVHIISVDLTYPGITLGPAMPNHGSRNTTTNLLQSSGAVGGINADFFTLGLYPSTPYGQVIQNGQVIEVVRGNNNFATFFIDMENTAFIEYITARIIFNNDGLSHFTVHSKNKISRDIVATVFDRSAIYNTSGLDSRQDGLIKIVVENDTIIHVSYPGELVSVPYNGYIVVVSEEYAENFIENILVGQEAELIIEANIDFENIWQAIGGAGTILEGGQPSSTGYVVAPNARHPRSAVGINQDGTKAFLVAVDGRSHSVGATHAEMATILLEIGAYRAMHFDGGGSTTMGIRTPGEGSVRLANTVSDGSQRRVVNALGVFNDAPLSVISGVDIRTFPSRAFVGDTLNVYPIGVDAHLNSLVLSPENIQLDVWPQTLRDGNSFFPTVPGVLDFSLIYGSFQATSSIEVMELAQIVPSLTSLELNTGGTAELNFTGLSPFGHRGQLNNVTIDLMPESVGTFSNGVFTAGSVSGVIRASIGNIVTYVGVNINGTGHVIEIVSDVSRNPYREILGTPFNAFDITVVGNTSLEPFIESDELSDYIQIRNNALIRFTEGSNLGVFAGATEVEGIRGGGIPTIEWTPSYRFHQVDNAAIISLNAGAGSLTGTSVYNWSFVNEVNQFDADHIIILINRPVPSLPAYEQQMLAHALEFMAKTRDVFVVSSFGVETSSLIENGVTYINLGGLFDGENVNNDFQILRFRIQNNNIRFDLQSAF